MNRYLDISDEVKLALDAGMPIVALESTIISHGMPYPQNVETALLVEEALRQNGAIPATIGIIRGRLKIGMSKDEIEHIGKVGNVMKVSRRDIPLVVHKQLDGATTVASTMILAHMAGIKVFATGGIGGVHRGASESFDVSADLTELSKTNVAVVCAGVKSILDIGLTLEYLETHGVPAVTYDSDEFPAFYTRKSGYDSIYRLNTVSDIAGFINAKWELGLTGGVVVANPIPTEYEMDYDKINAAIETALSKAEELGIKGKDTTPFLLAQVKSITEGKSLESNIALVLNNAKLAASIAKEMKEAK